MKISKSLKEIKKCCGCTRRPVFSVHSSFCKTCSRIAFRMKSRRFPPDAEAAVWAYIRAYDYRCYYTKMLLEMDDIRSPWYCVFDHLKPLDPRTVVLTSALVNEIKSALSGDEFWFYVFQLDDFKREGKPIEKIRLAYWRRHLPINLEKGPFGKKPKWPHPKDKKCDICGRPVFKIRSKYCLRCSHFNHRMELKGFPPEAVEKIREHLRTHGYVCQYTGISLDTENDRSPWYCVFDYANPGDPSSVVITCWLFAEMKTDLSIKEFWYYIRQLANYKRYGMKIRKKELHYWARLTSKELRFKSLRN